MHEFTDFDEAVVVDVETTGLDAETDRVVSVSLLRARFSALRHNPDDHLGGDTLDALFNPRCSIPREATQIHGITNQDVADEGTFAESAQQIREFIGNRPIIAHNAAFDKAFLNAEFKRAGVRTLWRNKSYCTMRRYQELQGGRRQGSSLDAVARQLGVAGRSGGLHRAEEDVRITCEIAEVFYLWDTWDLMPAHLKMDNDEQAAKSDEAFGELGCGCLVWLLGGFLVWMAYC